jgi:Flp pilus assembly protein CpaB
MSPSATRRPGGAAGFLSAAPLAFAAVVAVVLILATMWTFGLLSGGTEEPSTDGLVAVPTIATRVPAYTRLTRDHIWDARNARLAVVYLPPRSVTPEMLVKVSDVIGRVLAHDKAPGYVFTEADFLPKGTREGIVGGIPAGKRAIRVAADRVDGLHGLHAGDRFDLLATMPIAASGGQSFNFGGVYGQQLALEARLSNWQKQATVRVMVQNGVIVEPMNVRGVPTYQSSLTEGGSTRVRPVQEAVIAINPSEVAHLAEAMAVEATITAVPRSGRPDDVLDSRTPDLRPVSPFNGSRADQSAAASSGSTSQTAPFKVVETINGQKRELTAVPRP